MKKAYLVEVAFMTRVVMDEPVDINSDEGVISVLKKAQSKYMEKVQTELAENFVSIDEDSECPYDPEYDD